MFNYFINYIAKMYVPKNYKEKYYNPFFKNFIFFYIYIYILKNSLILFFVIKKFFK